MTSAACPDTLRFVSAHVTGKTHITFLLILFSSEPDFFRVDDNHKISGVDVRGKDCLSFPAQQVGGLYRDTAECLVLGVNDPPLARHFGSFGGKRLHGRKRARKLRATDLDVNLLTRCFILQFSAVRSTLDKNRSWRLTQPPYNCRAFL